MTYTVTYNGSLTGSLLPQHLDDLRRSGLSDEQIQRCGFQSMQAPDTIQRALRWRKYDGQLGDCLAFPFVNAAGKPTGYCRLKPDRPRESENGKPIKYESPKGASNCAYFPPGTLAALNGSSIPLLLTEGEKKSAKADQEQFPCIGLVGVWGWQKRRAKGSDGKRELIEDLASIQWQGRFVFLCFDSDALTNSSVRQAEWHLAETLKQAGAMVRIVRLPPGGQLADGSAAKVGIDDFLTHHGPEALRELLTGAVDPLPPEKVLTPNEATDDPHRLARLFISERCQHADGLTLRNWREEWQRWDGSAYRAMPEKELRAELTTLVKTEMDRINLVAQKLASEEKGSPVVRKITAAVTDAIAKRNGDGKRRAPVHAP